MGQQEQLSGPPCRLEGLLPAGVWGSLWDAWKSILSSYKTYGLFRERTKAGKRERLRWIREEKVYENGEKRGQKASSMPTGWPVHVSDHGLHTQSRHSVLPY